MKAQIAVGNGLFLTEIRRADRDLYVEYLKDKEISDNTLQIPYPYLPAHADEWILVNEAKTNSPKTLTGYAIRDGNGLLMGGAGYHDFEPGVSFKTEIGYWLAKRFWNKGYMTGVVGKLVSMGFNDWGLKRITATVFSHNAASGRCLEKNGFKFEGVLRNYYLKNGKLMDARLYAVIP